MPVSAVIAGGTEATSDGSRMAISGSSDASTSTSFSALAFTTEKAVTSEPVPLVVGMATKHGRGRLGCGRVCAGENNRFGGIDYRTAAERDNQIRIVVIHQLHAAHHGGDIRIRHHVVPHLPRSRAGAAGR